MYGWGRGEHGRLGFGDDKSSKMVPQRVQLLVGEEVVQVYHISYPHRYALNDIMILYNWISMMELYKLRLKSLNTCPYWVQVSCGGTHSVALTRDGRMFSVSF